MHPLDWKYDANSVPLGVMRDHMVTCGYQKVHVRNLKENPRALFNQFSPIVDDQWNAKLFDGVVCGFKHTLPNPDFSPRV
jgi:hypothetical protein